MIPVLNRPTRQHRSIVAAGGAGFSLVAHTSAGGTSTGVTSSAIDTTGANLIVLNASYYPGVGGVPVVSDSKGNTYTGLTLRSLSPSSTRLFYCVAPTVGSGHTFTLTASGGNIFCSVSVQAFGGANASPYESEAGATAGGTTSLQPGSVTPSVNGALVVTGASASAGPWSSPPINLGFSYDVSDFNFGVSEGGGIASLIQATAAAINPTWSITASGNMSAAIAVFKPA